MAWRKAHSFFLVSLIEQHQHQRGRKSILINYNVIEQLLLRETDAGNVVVYRVYSAIQVMALSNSCYTGV